MEKFKDLNQYYRPCRAHLWLETRYSVFEHCLLYFHPFGIFKNFQASLGAERISTVRLKRLPSG